jgi:hypothetical protein
MVVVPSKWLCRSHVQCLVLYSFQLEKSAPETQMIPQCQDTWNRFAFSDSEKCKEKKPKLAAVDIDQQYLDSLKEIRKRMETSNDADRMFLLSLLPAMKRLSPLDNMDFRVEVLETLQRKLRRHAAREVDLITIPSTSSASPALS